MRSVLITREAGFIGQNLVHRWSSARPNDHLVVVHALTYAASVRSLEPLIADRRIVFVKGDIREGAHMRHLFDEHAFTRVLRLAAESHIDHRARGFSANQRDGTALASWQQRLPSCLAILPIANRVCHRPAWARSPLRHRHPQACGRARPMMQRRFRGRACTDRALGQSKKNWWRDVIDGAYRTWIDKNCGFRTVE